MNPYWTNASANEKLAQILDVPAAEKAQIVNQIRTNLKEFVVEHFSLTALQEECRQALPAEYYEETGFMMAHAIEKGYPIDIIVTDEPTPVSAAKRGDKGEAGWTQSDGFYVKYTFEF